MKKLSLAILLFFGTITSLNAADVTLQWDKSVDATSYKIYLSSDMGVTWDAGADVGDVLEHIVLGVSDSGLVLFKVSAINAHGESVNAWSGAWYNGDWKPPETAKGLGVSD